MSVTTPTPQEAVAADWAGSELRFGPSDHVGDRNSRWMAVVSHTDPSYGGLSSAVPRLSQSVAAMGGVDVSIAAFCAPSEQFRPAGFDDDHLRFWPAARSPWLRSGHLRRQFRDALRAVDGVHIHGLWEASTALASRTARQLEKPYIVSAHGMLEPWALANKRLKKLAYGLLIEKGVIAHASCLHALTRAEAGQYRDFGARGPIAVIPNAVDVPEKLSEDLFFARFPHLRRKRLILFMGRLHPKKGLDLLGKAWIQVGKLFPEAHMVLAGPDAEGTRAQLEALFRAEDLTNSVTFTGMLDGAMKWSALAAAEIFTLPSYSEGLSMGALEAMGAGVPVLVTRNCNMPEVTSYRAGWEIAAKAEELTTALKAALRKQPFENKELGSRGGDLITSRYNSRHIAAAMSEVYRYVLNGIPPSTVELL